MSLDDMQKQVDFWAPIMKYCAEMLIDEGKNIRSHGLLCEYMRDLSTYLLAYKYQISDYQDAWDIPFEQRRGYSDIERLANDGDKDAMVYIEILNMFKGDNHAIEER